MNGDEASKYGASSRFEGTFATYTYYFMKRKEWLYDNFINNYFGIGDNFNRGILYIQHRRCCIIDCLR